MTDLTPIQQRKEEHLELCREQDVESQLGAGWSTVTLPHCALPDLDLKDVDTRVEFLGHKLAAPFLISSMTGGSPEGESVNLVLARLAESKGLAMGVGSQRILAEKRDSKMFSIRESAPKAVLFANIGAVQLNYSVGVDDCRFIVDRLRAQALVLHLNPLQEAVQLEGDRNFSGLWPKIQQLCKTVGVPVILKETGCGIDPLTAKRGIEAGVAALDVAGLGGTHWGFIEGLRSQKRRELGAIFRDWGIPSKNALEAVVAVARSTKTPVIASGGLRSGLDAARGLFLGADLCGMALPFLRAAAQGERELESFFDTQVEALKIALFCTGSANVAALKKLRGNL
jgi:isopentenyl-diphosphate Delta-isomerase